MKSYFLLEISDESRFDMIESFQWYDAIHKELGNRFENEIESELQRLIKNPFHFETKHKKVRVLFMKKFPFGIHFVIDDDKIKVIAFFHTSRNPKNWKKRISGK